MTRHRFVVERECGCHGRNIWRWQVTAVPIVPHRDDPAIVVAYAMTRRAARRKARKGQERLEAIYAQAAQRGREIHI